MKKTIIITGAAGNLGKTTSTNLLKQGYHVHATLGPNDDPNFIQHENLEAIPVNLLDENKSKDFINTIVSKNDDEVIALVCLVGGFAQGTIEDTGWDTIQKMLSLNFATAYNVARPLISYCKKKKKGLQLILIGSRPAIKHEEGKNFIAYALGKSLVFKFADFVNSDTNETGISASVIVPSTMDTQGTRIAMPDIDPSLWVPTENVANTISFILSDAGRMMRNPIYKLYNKS